MSDEHLSYRMLHVGRHSVGLSGLEEIFTALRDEGYEPEEGLQAELVSRAGAHNYIPPSAAAAYGAALLGEYAAFCRRAGSGAGGYGTWRGRPREQVAWYPTVDAALCDGCGKCIRFCSNHVYAWDAAREKVQVVEPFHCVVGCDACAAYCVPGALRFPPRAVLE
jgi:NAD-dependent dihydropyrimidine dehydrogenase PreA subunit